MRICGTGSRKTKRSSLFVRQIMARLQPGKGLMHVIMCKGLHLTGIIQQGRIEMRFIWKPCRAIEQWCPAARTETARYAFTALIIFGGKPIHLPHAVFLTDPCGHRRRSRAPATFAMAMANPVMRSGECKATPAAQTMAAQYLWFVLLCHRQRYPA